jgi:hypothetical protein
MVMSREARYSLETNDIGAIAQNLVNRKAAKATSTEIKNRELKGYLVGVGDQKVIGVCVCVCVCVFERKGLTRCRSLQ